MFPTLFLISHRDIAFLSLFIFLSLPCAISQLTVPLRLYTDNSCADPSTENSTYSANINVCIITTGLGSVSFPTTPCASGSVTLLGFSDSTCVEEISISNDGNGCIAPYKGDVAALIATCNQENEEGEINVSPTATATLDVGPVAGSAVATSPVPLPPTDDGIGGPPALSTKWIIIIVVAVVVIILLSAFGERNRRVTGSYFHVTRTTSETTTIHHGAAW